MATTKPKFSKKTWNQTVREADPKLPTEPSTAYKFSNGRTFHHKRNPYPS